MRCACFSFSIWDAARRCSRAKACFSMAWSIALVIRSDSSWRMSEWVSGWVSGWVSVSEWADHERIWSSQLSNSHQLTFRYGPSNATSGEGGKNANQIRLEIFMCIIFHTPWTCPSASCHCDEGVDHRCCHRRSYCLCNHCEICVFRHHCHGHYHHHHQ